MNILFCALHFGYFRNFESAICDLAERGHRVRLLAEEPERVGGREMAERLAARYANVSWTWAPGREGDTWMPVSRKLRHGLEYLRFLDRRYAGRPKLLMRAAERAPRGLLWIMRQPLMKSGAGRVMATAVLNTLERLMPASETVEDFLRAEQPDIVLLASLTYARSQQLEYMKAAGRLGIPTVACIMGYDHLSSKSIIDPVPDRLIVWNETQVREAVELHRIPADRVVVTGAQCYDQWFGRAPSRSREEFCRAVGLPPDRPFVLYVCSTMAPDPHEAPFVLEWIARIRDGGHPRLREAGLLIRPHFEKTRQWEGVDLGRWPNTVLHGRNPINPEAKTDYFDALYYSAAVVGIVTSAFLEAGIVGRPVLTVLNPRFAVHQEGMLHFEYLVNLEGGLLVAARDLDQHLDQLAATLEDGYEVRGARFLRAFIRPHGLDVPATPLFVDAVETAARLSPAPVRVPRWERALRPVVRSLAIAGTRDPWRWSVMDPQEAAEARMEIEKQLQKEDVVAAKADRGRRRAGEQQDAQRAKALRLRRRDRQKMVARVKGRIKQLVSPFHLSK